MRIRLSLAVSLFVLSAYHSYAGDQNNAPGNELIQYVRNAEKSGLKPGEIQQLAVKAGWPAAAVSDAIAYVQGGAKQAAQEPAAADWQATANRVSPAAMAQPAGAAAVPSVPPAKTGEGAGSAKPPVVNRGVPDDYQIGAGDSLEIDVWKEPDATVKGLVVRPDGRISMPLIKEVPVVGLTPTQAEKLITDQLSNLINSPDVTVVVTGIHSKKVYFVGAVRKQEPIPYTYTMTVMQALSEAGGLTEYAKRKKIYILRNENGREYQLPFDYDAVLKGRRMELNIPLLAGDTVVVPQ